MAESVTEPRVGGPEDVMALCEALLTLRDGEEMPIKLHTSRVTNFRPRRC